MTAVPDHQADPPVTRGLRQRKKARTRVEIQRQALRLFREQGYHATTIDQVADAAEVAPSTVFRYFPTKDALLALDGYYDFGPQIVEEFRAQPAGASAVQSLRAAMHAAFAALPPAERGGRDERDLAIVLVPEVLSANISLLADAVDTIAQLVGERAGRDRDDPAVRVLTAAAVGVSLDAVLRWARTAHGDLATHIEDALAHLETGIAL